MKLPNSDEEADFWDRFDTTQILEEGEEIELEYKPETAIENICIQCGERMMERKKLKKLDVIGCTYKLRYDATF